MRQSIIAFCLSLGLLFGSGCLLTTVDGREVISTDYRQGIYLEVYRYDYDHILAEIYNSTDWDQEVLITCHRFDPSLYDTHTFAVYLWSGEEARVVQYLDRPLRWECYISGIR